MMKEFRIKNLELRIKHFVPFGLFFILVALFLLPTVLAQTSCGPTTNPRAEGLVSAPSLSGIFGSLAGVCIIDPKAAFVPYKIPTFDSLESLYYTQSKNTSKVVISDTLPTITDQTIYLKTGDLTISTNPTGAGTAVIVVEGNLNINTNITYTGTNSGLVFVVKDNVYINPTVTQINAVIISQGTIYTAASSPTTCTKSSIVALTLTINGSLISLNDTKPIQFCRTLVNNANAAEKINHQVKYLVLLRNLISDTLQKWSEIP